MEENCSKFRNLYKSANKEDAQEKRRNKLLQEQKRQRSQLIDGLRELNIPIRTDLADIQQQETCNRTRRPHTYNAKYDRDDKLQLSEWLKDKPEDLEQWFLVPVPKGQRCIVVSFDGYAEMYNKSGRFVCSFRAMLPGINNHRNSLTILDCIYVEKVERFYVLDALAYGSQEFLNCEAQFRFFWLTSKFNENAPTDISDYNQYTFKVLKYYDFADRESVISCLVQYPQWVDDVPELDGFLFYHKEASYTCGYTPLVGWLFAYMIPEVLGLPVSEKYLDERPLDYVDYLHFITVFDEKLSKKRYNRRRSNTNGNKMDEGLDENSSDVIDMEKELI